MWDHLKTASTDLDEIVSNPFNFELYPTATRGWTERLCTSKETIY